MDYNQEYIDLLKRSLASENETVRLYLAVMALSLIHICRTWTTPSQKV